MTETKKEVSIEVPKLDGSFITEINLERNIKIHRAYKALQGIPGYVHYWAVSIKDTINTQEVGCYFHLQDALYNAQDLINKLNLCLVKCSHPISEEIATYDPKHFTSEGIRR